MKQKLVSLVRNFLPKKIVSNLEEFYRKLRIKLVTLRYGNPAKNLRVIAITGTNGKTTTACYVNEILKEAGMKTAMFTTALIEINGKSKINNLNSTVASTVKMQEFLRDAKNNKVDYVILEVTSHALIQYKLASVPIELAALTNLTQDHLDYHGTMQKYAKAKGMLFSNKPNYIVLNRDDEWFKYFNKFKATHQKISYGTDSEADSKIEKVKLYKKGSEAKLTIDYQTKLNLATALPGKYNVYNMVAAATITYILGVKLNAIIEGIANLEGVPGRFERVEINQPFDCIVDYAHTPDALEKLLESAKTITKGRIILVFGATGDRDKAKRPIMGKIAAKYSDRIILTDDESYNEDPEIIRDMVREGIREGGGDAITTEIGDRYSAIEKAISIAKRNDLVIVAGMGHEQYRIIKGERLSWNDAKAILKIAKKKYKK